MTEIYLIIIFNSLNNVRSSARIEHDIRRALYSNNAYNVFLIHAVESALSLKSTHLKPLYSVPIFPETPLCLLAQARPFSQEGGSEIQKYVGLIAYDGARDGHWDIAEAALVIRDPRMSFVCNLISGRAQTLLGHNV